LVRFNMYHLAESVESKDKDIKIIEIEHKKKIKNLENIIKVHD
jgi:hypothetical protein